MPKSLGDTAQLRASGASPLVDITRIASHGDSSILLINFSSSSNKTTRHGPAPHCECITRRPTQATSILPERHQGRDPAECDRLDVYGIPFSRLGDMVAACVEPQRREIVSRLVDKDWYSQRYGVGGGHWQRALVVVRQGQEEWAREDGSTRQTGLSVVFFDLINQEESGATEGNFWERKATSVEGEEVLTRELKAELNWQHSVSQFRD
ncbi:hypothetical protein F5Y10DRAFT_242996 [Nemania abortiva]|nr:hypothetical protein F5Y10DRAFT_242996 [Nemania abortiva]